MLHSEKTPYEGRWGAGYSRYSGAAGREWSWGCIILDCGEPSYQNFMLDQAKKLIENIPDSSGMCIDRLDPVRLLQFPA